MDVAADTYTFFLTIGAGIACGILYDFFAVLAGRVAKRKLIHAFDLFFLILSSVCITMAFYVYNSCKLRLYMFVGVLLGLILHCLLFSNIIVCIFEKILKIFEIIFKILLTPLRFLYKILLVYLFIPVTNFLKKLANKFGLKIKTIRGSIFYGNNKRNRKKNSKKKNKSCCKKEKNAYVANHIGGACGCFHDDKRCNASAADN